MSGQHNSLRDTIRENSRRVDHACRAQLGIGVMVWRALDSLVSLGTLGLAGFAIDQGTDPTLALTIAMIIISGPKLAEWWLVRQDVVDYEEVRERRDGD